MRRAGAPAASSANSINASTSDSTTGPTMMPMVAEGRDAAEHPDEYASAGNSRASRNQHRPQHALETRLDQSPSEHEYREAPAPLVEQPPHRGHPDESRAADGKHRQRAPPARRTPPARAGRRSRIRCRCSSALHRRRHRGTEYDGSGHVAETGETAAPCAPHRVE